DGALTNIICAHLASNGIPAMMCHFPLFADRCQIGSRSAILSSPHGCRIFGQALLEAPLDARRTVDIMLSRPEINPDKVSISGISMGGFIASATAGNDARIHKAAILLAGGDLHAIIYNASRETKNICEAIDNASPEDREFLETVLEKIEPLNNTKELQKLAKQNNLMIVNAENDQIIPSACSQKLVKACGLIGKNIVLPGLGHYTAIAALPKILDRLTSFFTDNTVPPRKPEKLPEDKKIIQDVFTQFYKLFEFKAPRGKCIYICATVNVKDHIGKVLFNGSTDIIRGDEKQFKLLLNLKVSPLGGAIQHLALGCDPAPWILSGKGTLYSGELERLKDSFPSQYFVPQITQFQQFMTGIFAMGSSGMLAPLDKWVRIEIKRDINGQRYVNIEGKGIQAEIYLNASSETPRKILVNSGKLTAEIIFTQWDLEAPAPPGIFSPEDKEGRKIVKVKQYNLDRMFAALINFAVSKT
ncbi:MAG: prolyl oligopeptidase family serine peptidase, partial [Victivallaceae bacterium]